MTQTHRYAPRTLAAAYARSALGLCLTLVPLSVMHPAPWIAIALSAGAVLFAAHAIRTWVCQLTRACIDDDGIAAAGPFAAAIRWDELQSLDLNYYATRSDRTGGWMQLTVRDARNSIRIESTLEDFSSVAARVGREALARNRRLDERTRGNFAFLGIQLSEPSELPLQALGAGRG